MSCGFDFPRSVSIWGCCTSQHCHSPKWGTADKVPTQWLPNGGLSQVPAPTSDPPSASQWDLWAHRASCLVSWSSPAKAVCPGACHHQSWSGILALHIFRVFRPISNSSRKHILNHLWRFPLCFFLNVLQLISWKRVFTISEGRSPMKTSGASGKALLFHFFSPAHMTWTSSGEMADKMQDAHLNIFKCKYIFIY